MKSSKTKIVFTVEEQQITCQQLTTFKVRTLNKDIRTNLNIPIQFIFYFINPLSFHLLYYNILVSSGISNNLYYCKIGLLKDI